MSSHEANARSASGHRPVRRALSRVARVQLASACPARASLAASVCCVAGSACAPARSGTMQRQRDHASAPCTSTAAPRSCSLARALSVSRQAVPSSAPRDGLRVSPPAVSVSRRRSSRHHGALRRCLCAHTSCFVSAARRCCCRAILRHLCWCRAIVLWARPMGRAFLCHQ